MVRLDKLGDFVLSTPMLRELRRNAPAARITLVVEPSVHELARRCPHVDEVLAFDFHVRSRFWRLVRHRRALAFGLFALRGRRFELALCPRWDADQQHAGYVAYFSGASHRVSWTERTTAARREANAGEDRLFTRVLEPPAPVHEVERNLEFLRRLGATIEDDAVDAWTAPEDEERAVAVLASAGIGEADRFHVVAPGAGEPKRAWAPAGFVEVGRRLASQGGGRVVVVGSVVERHLGAQVASMIGEGAVDLTGRLRLPELLALLRRAQGFVGNDTGSAHLAAAAGVAVVAISCLPEGAEPGHTNAPQRFRPWSPLARVVRPPAAAAGDERPILRVTVDEVMAALAASAAPPA